MIVLDASAIMCWLKREPGAEKVQDHLANSCINTVNWSEVLQKCDYHGLDASIRGPQLKALGVTVIAFHEDDAAICAKIWPFAKHISLADRACLATAMRLNLPVLTCEGEWQNLQFDGKPVIEPVR